MARLRSILGFPASSNYQFRIAGQKYRIGVGGLRSLRLFARIAEAHRRADDHTWLLPSRDQIRQLVRRNPRAPLTLVASRTDDVTVRRLAIWLRGRCGGTLGTSTMARLAETSDRLVRKEAVRCLKRLGAWAELRSIASHEKDPQIRRIAAQSPSPAFTIRLASFAEHTPPLAPATRPMQWVVPGEIDVSRGRRPKPRWLIRMILERIRRLVTAESF